MNYKNYRRLFESVKRKSEKKVYSKQLTQLQGDAKKTWQITKEVIGKARKTQPLLPSKIIVNNTEINEGK